MKLEQLEDEQQKFLRKLVEDGTLTQQAVDTSLEWADNIVLLSAALIYHIEDQLALDQMRGVFPRPPHHMISTLRALHPKKAKQ